MRAEQLQLNRCEAVLWHKLFDAAASVSEYCQRQVDAGVPIDLSGMNSVSFSMELSMKHLFDVYTDVEGENYFVLGAGSLVFRGP